MITFSETVPEDINNIKRQAEQSIGHGLVDARAALKADVRFFVTAGIDGVSVAVTSAGQFVEVRGTASANRFARGWLELGSGKKPRRWTRVADPIELPVNHGLLGSIPAQALRGLPIWSVRVTVEHRSGKQRTARFVINLQ